MEKVTFAALSEETNKKLNFLLRRLASMKERADAELESFTKKLSETSHKLDVFYWSEKTFEQAAKHDLAQFYTNVFNSFIEKANTGNSESISELGAFVDNFDDMIAKSVARDVSCSSFSTMQTANLATHYKSKAYAELMDLI